MVDNGVIIESGRKHLGEYKMPETINSSGMCEITLSNSIDTVRNFILNLQNKR